MAKARKPSRSSTQRVQLHEPFKVSVGKLQFDTKNPRYAADQPSGRASEAQIITQLLATADIAELVQSITSNGYIDIEPLVVMPSDGKFLVLEGNRRLAAIRLLSNPQLAGDCNFVAPVISADVAQTLRQVTAYAVKKREDARDFSGSSTLMGHTGGTR